MVPTLSIQPADALIDVPRGIRVEHVAPGQTVEITALTRRNGVLWQSHAAFVAGEDGSVDLTRDAPVSGDYAGVSPMGLIWSQSPWTRPAASPSTIPSPSRWSPRSWRAPAQVQGKFTQRLAAEGVTRQDVREHGLVGTLYLPPGAAPGSHPAVLILNGSGGGINEPRAALYASRGYAAFALAYFKAPGLSDYISNTPLEYFQSGLRWLRDKVRPKHDFVAVSGQSRGGELVLLLGATFPTEVSAVVAYVPGAVVHSGQNACDPKIGREGPTWLLGGKPLPHVWENNRTATWAPFDEGPSPHRHEKAILTALQDPDAVARARIKVEDIQGPVMLLSATDDGSWPSSLYSKMVRDKLTEVDHPIPSGGWITRTAATPSCSPTCPPPSWSTPTPCPARSAPAAATPGQRPRRPGILGRRADVPGRGGEGAGKRWPRPPVRAAQRRRRHGPARPRRLNDTPGDSFHGTTTHRLRRRPGSGGPARRPEIRRRHLRRAPPTRQGRRRHQGSYDALFDPALPGLTLAERLLVALYAARLTPAPSWPRTIASAPSTPTPAPPISRSPKPASRRTPPTRV